MTLIQRLTMCLIFSGNKIEEDALKIECSGDEVNMMFLDFVRMLSSTRHLAMCVFVNGNAEVDTVKRLERFSGWSECFKVVRDMNKHDDKICIYIGFINGLTVKFTMLITRLM